MTCLDGVESMACIAGMGHDIVDCVAFSEQVQQPGTRFEQLFSSRERLQCRMRGGSKDDYARHLAVRWAGKEAFLKAWSHALSPELIMPYTIEDFPWASVEIVSDSLRRPSVYITGDVQEKLYASLRNRGLVSAEQSVRCHISVSHDGSMASAVVLLEIMSAAAMSTAVHHT